MSLCRVEIEQHILSKAAPDGMARVIYSHNPFDTSKHIHEFKEIGEQLSLIDVIPKEMQELPEELIVTSINGAIIQKVDWEETLVAEGDVVVVFESPGGDDGKSILRLIALIALTVIAPWASAILVPAGGFLGGVLTVSFVVAGALLVNAILPPVAPGSLDTEDLSSSRTYGIDGAKNTSDEGAPIPVCYGPFRMAGNIINFHTRNIGNEQYLYLLLNAGEGVSSGLIDVELNEQPIAGFADAEVQIRLGDSNQELIDWFADTTSPTSVGVVVTTAFQTRTTSLIDRFRLDFVFPQGLVEYRDDGTRVSRTVVFDIEYKKTSEPTIWTTLTHMGSPSSVDDQFIYFEYDNYDTEGNYVSTTPTEIRDTLRGGTFLRGDFLEDGGGLEVGMRLDQQNYTSAPDIKLSQTSAVRFSFYSPHLDQDTYDVRVRRTTAESSDAKIRDSVSWTDLNDIVEDDVAYKHTALVGLKIRLTDQLSSLPTVTYINGGRVIRFWDTANQEWRSGPSTNPAWIAWDALTNKRFGGQVVESRLDIDAWVDWGEYCDNEGLTFQGVFDTRSNLWDATMHIFRAGHARSVKMGTRYSIAIDRAIAPSQMFTVGNIIKGSFKQKWMSMTDRANEVELHYFDETDRFKRRTIKVYDDIILSDAPRNTASATMYGIVDATRAAEEATYMLLNNRYIKSTVTFKTPSEAVAVAVGDVFSLQHDQPEWSEGGRLEAGSTATSMKIDKVVNFDGGESYKFMVRFDYLIRDVATITGITGKKLTLSGYGGATNINRCQLTSDNGVDKRITRTDTGVIWVDDATGLSVTDSIDLIETDAIEIRNVVAATSGDLTTVPLTSAMPSAPSEHYVYMVGEESVIESEWRVTNLTVDKNLDVTISGATYDERIYNWTPLTIQPSPDTGVSRVVPHVINLDAVEGTVNIGGILRPVLDISWDLPEDFENYGGVLIELNIDEGGYRFAKEQRGGLNTTVEVSHGDSIDVRVVAMSSDGRYALNSSAPEVLGISMVGDNIPPAEPTSVALALGGVGLHLSWVNPVDSDFAGCDIKKNIEDNEGTAVLIFTTAKTQVSFDDILATNDATDYFYWLRAVDRSGNTSAWVATTPTSLNPVSFGDGDDALAVNYTNNAHSVPVTNAGVETWTGSGGDFYVFEGTTRLTLEQNAQSTAFPITPGEYRLNIVKISGDTLTEPAITGAASTTATLADWASDLTTATVYRITAYILTAGSVQVVISTDVTLAPSDAGADGSDGSPGTPGTDGVDGLSVHVANVYRRSASAPSTPNVDDGQYNFTTKVLTPPTDWFVEPPAGTDPLYVSTGTFSIVGQTGTDITVIWTSPDLLVQDGADGAAGGDGADGLSVHVANIYLRSASSPGTPSVDDGEYNFTTRVLTPPTNWFVEPPAGTDPLYVSTGSFSVVGPTGIDSTVVWTSPDLLVSDGVDGSDGNDAFTVSYTNNSHAVPVTNLNVETWTGSGGLFYAYEGGTVLTLDQNAQSAAFPATPGEYRLNITRISGDTLDEPAITGAGTTEATLADWANDLTTVTVYRITAYIRGSDGSTLTLSSDVTLSPSNQGADGADGDFGEDGVDSVAVNYTNNSHAVPVTNLGVETWTGSGGKFYTYEGAALLTLDTNTQGTSYPTTPGEYRLNIVKISGDTLSEPAITGSGTTEATLANWASNLTTATVYRITAYILTSGSVQVSVSTDVTLSPSDQGSDGSDGSDGDTGPPGGDGTDGTDGADSVAVNYTNNNHSVPVTNLGVETWTGSGGKFYAFEGPSLLLLSTNNQGTSYPTNPSQYRLNITRISGDTLNEPGITGSGTTEATLANWAGNLTTVTVYRISCYILTADSTQVLVTTDVTLSPSDQGSDGTDGDDGTTGTPGRVASFTYDDLDTTQLAAGSSRYAMLTARGTNTSGSTNNFHLTDAILINKKDLPGADFSLFYADMKVGDRVTYYISQTRWFLFVVDQIFGVAVGSGDSAAFKFGVTLVDSVDPSPTTNIPTTPGTDVNFEFSRVLDTTNPNFIVDPDFDLSTALTEADFWFGEDLQVGTSNTRANRTLFLPTGGANGGGAVELRIGNWTGSTGGGAWITTNKRHRINSNAFGWNIKYKTDGAFEFGTATAAVLAIGYDVAEGGALVSTSSLTFELPNTANAWTDLFLVSDAFPGVDVAQYWEFRIIVSQATSQNGIDASFTIDSIFVYPVAATFGTQVNEGVVESGTVPKADVTTDSGKVLDSSGSWVVQTGGAEVNNLTQAVTWANIPFTNVPTGITSVTVALGNHLHSGVYAPLASPNFTGFTSFGGNTIGGFEAVSGGFGSVQVSGAQVGGFEGYNIAGRFTFMFHPTTERGGIYDDVNNRWVLQWNAANASSNEKLSLYCGNAVKLDTTSVGVSITGSLTTTGAIELGHASDTTLARNAAGKVEIQNKPIIKHASTAYESGEVTFSTGAPSGGSNGDIWYRYS